MENDEAEVWVSMTQRIACVVNGARHGANRRRKKTENDWRMVEGTYAVSLIVRMCGAVIQGGTQLRRCGVRLRVSRAAHTDLRLWNYPHSTCMKTEKGGLSPTISIWNIYTRKQCHDRRVVVRRSGDKKKIKKLNNFLD